METLLKVHVELMSEYKEEHRLLHGLLTHYNRVGNKQRVKRTLNDIEKVNVNIEHHRNELNEIRRKLND